MYAARQPRVPDPRRRGERRRRAAVQQPRDGQQPAAARADVRRPGLQRAADDDRLAAGRDDDEPRRVVHVLLERGGVDVRVLARRRRRSRACSSPKAYSNLALGEHEFRVRATDAVRQRGRLAGERTSGRSSPTRRRRRRRSTAGRRAPSPTTSATFTFSSSEPGSTFECSLDGGAWSGCTSPQPVHRLRGRVARGPGPRDRRVRQRRSDAGEPDLERHAGLHGRDGRRRPRLVGAAERRGQQLRHRLGPEGRSRSPAATTPARSSASTSRRSRPAAR